jgi:pyruvate,orthophosphate dikinase
MKAAEAVVTAEGGTTSHAAIVARELDTPAVVGCEGFDIDESAGRAEVGGRTVEPGTRVRVDGTDGELTLLE